MTMTMMKMMIDRVEINGREQDLLVRPVLSCPVSCLVYLFIPTIYLSLVPLALAPSLLRKTDFFFLLPSSKGRKSEIRSLVLERTIDDREQTRTRNKRA